MKTKFSYRIFALANWILLRWNIVLTPTLFQQPRGHALDIVDRAFDYIRMATIKATLKELDKRGTKGALAELGVYRGGTSAMMNGLKSISGVALSCAFGMRARAKA